MEMQIKRNSDALAVARKIVSEGGVTSFWRGNLMNLIRVTPHKVTGTIIDVALCSVRGKSSELQALSKSLGFKVTLNCTRG